jgi:hypothetical protein
MTVSHGTHALAGLLKAIDLVILHRNKTNKTRGKTPQEPERRGSMAYARTAVAPSSLHVPRIAPRAKRGLLQRLLDVIEQHNAHRAERDIARFLRSSGSSFTDATEREIERRFLS